MADGVFFGDCDKDGKLILDSQVAFRTYVRRKFAGKKVELVIRARRSQRSLAQNRWYWKFAVPVIAEEIGYDKHEYDECNHWLLRECFGSHKKEILGVEIEIQNVTSSTKLTTKQFSELMEWIVRWAATNLGIVIPLPNEIEME